LLWFFVFMIPAIIAVIVMAGVVAASRKLALNVVGAVIAAIVLSCSPCGRYEWEGQDIDRIEGLITEGCCGGGRIH